MNAASGNNLISEAAPVASVPPIAMAGQMPAGRGRMALAIVCGVILVVMMTLTVVDVLGRYVLGSPLIGATELTELLLVSVVFIGLPAVSMDDDHVSVDLMVTRLPEAVQPWRQIGVGLISAAMLSTIAWRLWVQGDQIASYGGVTNSPRLPVAPVAWFCALCTGAAVAVTLWHVLGLSQKLFSRMTR